jgi:hypothetical protein
MTSRNACSDRRGDVVIVDQPRRPRPLSRASEALRRWFDGPSPAVSAAGGSSTELGADLDADLIADIVAMTGKAVEDGLPLSAVLDDLRLVLDLAPADVLPVDALRACALEWGRVSRSPYPARRTVPVTPDDIEGHLWQLLGSSPDDLPGRVVIVRLAVPESGDDVARRRTSSVLDPADLLSAAVGVASDVFDGPGEHVVLLRTPPSAVADRVVALLPAQTDHDDPGDRVALCRAALASASVPSTARWVVEVHRLDDHPSGLLASVREVLGPTPGATA